MTTLIFCDGSYCIGSHIPFCKSLLKTCEYCTENNMYAFQFFLGSNIRVDRTRISEEDTLQTKQYLTEHKISIFSHLPYLYNLCGTATKVLPLTKGRQLHIIHEIEYELSVLASIGGCCVLHPGSLKGDRKIGISAISNFINVITFPKNAKLALENCAGEGTKFYRTLEEFKDIYDGVNEEKKKHLYLCLDTAHTFSFGEYDLSETSGVKKLFDRLKKLKLLSRVALFHLNDSEVELGSKKDKHQFIGKGCIWGKSIKALCYLLKLCKYYKIPCVLETCVDDYVNLANICEKISKR